MCACVYQNTMYKKQYLPYTTYMIVTYTLVRIYVKRFMPTLSRFDNTRLSENLPF